MVHLDEIDLRILRAIQKRGDISSADLAESVGASAASCWRRLKALDGAGVLGPVVRLVNADAVGRGLNVVCAIRMKSHEVATREEFERFLQGRDEVVECYSLSGEWDYQLRILVSDVAAYENFLMHKLLSHPSVSGSSSHFALKRIKYTTVIPI